MAPLILPLSPGEYALLVGYEAGQDPEPVWTLWRKGKVAIPARNLTPFRPIRSQFHIKVNGCRYVIYAFILINQF
jgi:hypothetical protein